WVILVFNSVFSSLTCLTLCHIGWRMYGISVGRAAAWTWALFPYAIYWPTRVVWETSLTAFLLSLALLLTLRMGDQTPRPSTWVLFGLVWGEIGLTNTAVLSMMPFSLLWLLARASWRSHLVGVALCVITAMLVITPWVVRNYVGFLIPAAFGFAGLWMTLRNRIAGGFLLACFLLIYPIPYYLVNPFPRYKHPIEPEIILLAVYLFWVARRVEIRWPNQMRKAK